MPAKTFGLTAASSSLVLTQPVAKLEIAWAAGAQHPALASGPWLLSSSDCTMPVCCHGLSCWLVEGEVCSPKWQLKTQMSHVLFRGF